MTRSRRTRLLGLLAVGVLALASCGSDDDDDTTATTAGGGGGVTTTAGGGGGGETTTSGTTGGGGGGEAWAVDTSDCPDGVEDPIEGTIKIGTTMPLSGGAAAAAFAPVAEGFEAYIEFANENGLVEGHDLELTIEDDQFNANLTTGAVESLLDETGVHLFAGQIGTANNLAVRELLNGECYPHLFINSGSPEWGRVAEFPWSTGVLAPYNTETAIYVEDIKAEFPDGATAAVFTVNSEFGQAYADTFAELAPDANIEIVDEQTIESAETNPPAAQVTSIADNAPDVILAVPLGAQCPQFLGEVANAKAANAGWEPRIYITATCASTLLLTLAGEAANGIYTITAAKDVADPKNAEDPAVKEYRDFMTSFGFPADGDFATAAAGWVIGEYTVAVLNQAASSEAGLTRASIMNAARNFTYTPSLGREGVTFTMAGEDDPYLVESLQVVQFDAATKTYTDIGDLITKFEGATEAPS
jgi:ABC-type branched-subunit amino acid transport system substrate-binding protein